MGNDIENGIQSGIYIIYVGDGETPEPSRWNRGKTPNIVIWIQP